MARDKDKVSKDLRGREKGQKRKQRKVQDSPSPKRRGKISKEKLRSKKTKRRASSSSESSSASSESSSYSSSGSSSSYSSSDSGSESSNTESSTDSSRSSSNDRRGRKGKKQLTGGKKVRNGAKRQSRDRSSSVEEPKKIVAKEVAVEKESHQRQKMATMASPPPPPPQKEQVEQERKDILKAKESELQNVKDEGMDEGNAARRDLPKSYQRLTKRPPSSSSDESMRNRSPVREKAPSISDRSSSESPQRFKGRAAKSTSLSPRRRKRSPSPVATKIHVGNLTRNVNKDHVVEIFSVYGKVRHVEMPINRNNLVLRNYAYVEFDQSSEAEKAVKYMDGGWIDGQEVQTKLVLPMKDRRRTSPGRFYQRNRRRSPPRYRPPQRYTSRRSRSPPRRRSPSPPRRRSRTPPRRRSRSPVRSNFRRRRGSLSSGSSRSPVRRRPRSRSPSVSRRRRFSRSSTSS